MRMMPVGLKNLANNLTDLLTFHVCPLWLEIRLLLAIIFLWEVLFYKS